MPVYDAQKKSMNNRASNELARRLEQAEAAAWQDMVAAANPAFKRNTGLHLETITGDTYISCPAIPFVHFNCVMGVGTNQPVTEEYMNKLLGYFTERKLETVYLCLVEGLDTHTAGLLSKKGFAAGSSWDRTWRDDHPLDNSIVSSKPGWDIHKVDASSAAAWAGFVSGTYQMPVTKNWLLDFAVREGWHHYMLMENSRILAVRSIFIGKDKMAFWGIEAPIPGIMTVDYSMDFALTHHIVKEGLQMGVKGFVGDIEMVSDAADTPTYTHFKELGFTIPYRRTIYKLR